MVDKDLRPMRDAQSLAEQELARIAGAEDPFLTARPTRPVEFLDKKEIPNAGKVIRYTEDGRPISPRYDQLEEEVSPKASPALEPAISFPSTSQPTGVSDEAIPGLEDVSSPKTDSPASVAKGSGPTRETNTGMPTSSPNTSTSPGSTKPPVVPRQPRQE